MILVNTKNRTDKPEIMDDFSMKGEILRDALDKIAVINQLLGGNSITISGVEKLISGVPETTEITILDIGCGNGDMLRKLADFAEKYNRRFKFIGIDANNFTILHAKEMSIHYPNISYRMEDVFNAGQESLHCDILLCTLTLHHFKDKEILKLMKSFYSNAQIGIVVNDLQRSAVAYRLFDIICFIFRLNDMSRKDGLTSILRGFKHKELVEFSRILQFKNYKIQWKWAFRYQWVISKI